MHTTAEMRRLYTAAVLRSSATQPISSGWKTILRELCALDLLQCTVLRSTKAEYRYTLKAEYRYTLKAEYRYTLKTTSLKLKHHNKTNKLAVYSTVYSTVAKTSQ